MRFPATMLMLGLSLAPLPVLAHGEAPTASHGGMVQEAGEMWLELVVNGTDVFIYVLDESRQPMPASSVTGTATVMVAGKAHKISLVPAGANSLHGTLPVEATGRIAATVSLKAGGKAASARFMPAS